MNPSGYEGCKTLTHGRVAGRRMVGIESAILVRLVNGNQNAEGLRGLSEDLSAICCDDLFRLMGI